MHMQEAVKTAVQMLHDPNPEPWKKEYYQRVFQCELAKRIKDVPTLEYEYRDRDKLYSLVHSIGVPENTPIDYLEFGVFGGDSFRKWMNINTHSESRFFGFDSFEGLPEDWPVGNKKKGDFTTNGETPQIDDHRGAFIKGWFNDTLPDFLKTFVPQNQLVIHMDADLYSSTLYVLTQLEAIIKPGTILVFDDFNPTDEFAAFHQFTIACRKEWKLLATRDNLGKLGAQIIEY